jgi:hypothetical protein
LLSRPSRAPKVKDASGPDGRRPLPPGADPTSSLTYSRSDRIRSPNGTLTPLTWTAGPELPMCGRTWRQGVPPDSFQGSMPERTLMSSTACSADEQLSCADWFWQGAWVRSVLIRLSRRRASPGASQKGCERKVGTSRLQGGPPVMTSTRGVAEPHIAGVTWRAADLAQPETRVG